MSSSVIVAFDVGGTQIKAAAVIDGAALPHTIGHYDSIAGKSADEIIANFVSVFAEVLGKAGPDAAADGLGLAFPGPFDYAEGISRIRGLRKFDALYGLPVGQLLDRELRADPRTKNRLASPFRIRFENDAALFGLGESAPGGAAEKAERAVCLTIGTGLGSCFLERGRLVKHREDVPAEGWVYTMPHQTGTADDYISRKGVLDLSETLGLDRNGRDVRDLAALADSGDEKALRLFEKFGRRAFCILKPALLEFRPGVIVFGGQISKSAHLFVPAFKAEAAFAGLDATVRVSSDTLAAAMRGIYDLLTEEKDG